MDVPALSDQMQPFELFAGLDPPSSIEDALRAIAERLRETFQCDIVILRASEEDRKHVARAYSAADPALGAAYGPALLALRPETRDLGLTSLRSGSAVVWTDLMRQPAVVSRLAEVEDKGIPVADARERLSDASVVAMPLRTVSNPHLGAVGLMNVSATSTLGSMERDALQALAPQISLAVQNALLRDRNRNTRVVLEAMIATTRNGVLVIDTDGIITVANKAYADILKVSTDDLVGQPAERVLREIIVPRFVDPSAYEHIAMRLDQRPNVTLRDQLETIDGTVLERFSAPVRDPDGNLLGRVVILSDITVRHRALIEARELAEQNAALLEREEERGREEIAIACAAHLLASALTRQDIHEQLVTQVQALVDADKVVLYNIRRRGDIIPAASFGVASSALRGLRRKRHEGIPGRVLQSRRAFICRDVLRERSLDLRGAELEGTQSLVAVPIELADRVYGVIAIYGNRIDQFDERDLRVLGDLAHHAESAIQNALLFEHERQIAETLQDALLAEEPPEVDGLEMATLYRAAAGALVGGDVHDVWILAPGRVAVMVGDVAGKGVQAAGTTGMVRYLLEGISVHEHDPARMLDQLSIMVTGRLGDAAFVTGFLAVIDVDNNELTWASAGHPPPILMRPDGAFTTLDDPDPPLGFPMNRAYRSHLEDFSPGSLLVLTTDGIIEARSGDEMFGEDRQVETVVRLASGSALSIAQGLYQAAREFARGALHDDAALAVVRRTV